ncbi:MAG: PAS domain S-box protein, partial [Anaerolineae bacterium]
MLTYGFSREEFLRMTIRDIRPQDELPQLLEGLARPLSPMRQSDGVKHRLKDGRLIDVRSSSHPVDMDGRTCALVLAQDVTETKRVEDRVRYMTRLYATISQVNEAIVRVKDRGELFQKICDVAVDSGGFRLAWIGSLDRHTGKVTPQAHAGHEAGYLPLLDINVDDPIGSKGPTGTAIRTGEAVFVDDIATDPNFNFWRADALERGYRSYAAVPIRENGVVVGNLALYAAEPGFFNQDEMRLLEEIGQDISFALDTLELEQKRKHLESERAHLLSTIESSLNEIYVFDPDSLRFQYVNRGALGNLGYSAEAMRQLTPPDLKPQFSEAQFRELLAPLVKGEREKIVFETMHQRADGSQYPVEVHLQLIRQDNQPMFLAVVLDTTERRRAAAELQDSERRYREVLTHMMEGCQILDYDWRWVYINDTAALQVGRQPEQLLMQRVMDVFPGFETSELFATLQESMEDRQPRRTERKMLMPDGAFHWLEFSMQPVAEGLFVLSFDVTERRQAELARSESEQRFRRFFELGVVGMAMTSPEKGFLEVNDRMCEMLGYTRDEFTALTWQQLSYPPDLDLDLQHFNRLLAGDLDGYSIEKRFIHKNGSLVHTAMSVNAVRSAKGKLDYCAALLEDITERKQAEAQLKASEENYRALFTNIPDGVYRTTADGKVLAANPALVHMLGYESLEEFQQVNVPDLYIDAGERTELIDLLNQDAETHQREARLRCKGGQQVTVLDSSRAIRDERGQVRYFEGTLTDITARKRAEDALRLENRRFQRFIESNIVGILIGDTAGGVSLANDYYLNILGVTRQDLLSGKVKWTEFTPPEWLPADEKAITQLRATGTCEPYEKEYQRADGTRVPVFLADAMLPGPDEQIAAFVLDISERKQADKRIRQQLNRITGLRDVDRAITSSFDLRLTMSTILAQVREQLGATAAAVSILDPLSNMLNCVAASGLRQSKPEKSMVRLGQGLAGTAAMQRHAVHYSDLKSLIGSSPEVRVLVDDGLTDYYGVPLISKGQVKGILEVFHRSQHANDQDWLEDLETLAGQAAIAIDNIQMLEGLNRSNLELMQAYDATIEGWSRALDLRDKETEGHTRRVTELTVRLARAMGIPEQDLTKVRWGALMHDIGKLGVPDSILLKPGELTEGEWVQMKMHPQLAYEMLSPIQYLRGALDIPLCHHEKWDGSGYPRGLRGDQIPLVARIFAIVDTWDALRSDRPYRAAWPEAKTLEHIRALTATHLDPQVVSAFFENRIFE